MKSKEGKVNPRLTKGLNQKKNYHPRKQFAQKFIETPKTLLEIIKLSKVLLFEISSRFCAFVNVVISSAIEFLRQTWFLLARKNSQTNDFDQYIISGSYASERQENIIVNESNSDRDFTVGTSSDNLATNENTMIMKTLKRCSNKNIGRETTNFVDRAEERNQNAILIAIVSIVDPEIELAITSKNASSGQDSTSVTKNSKRGEHTGIIVSFENTCGNNNVLHVPNVNDETRNNSSDVVSELSVPETRFDWQTHIHSMMTGQTTQTNQTFEFFTGLILTQRMPPSPQHQNLSTQVSQDKNLSMVEQTPRNQNSGANNSTNRLADPIAGSAAQQQPEAATMLKLVSTNTLIFDGKNKNFELFEDLFHTMLKMQPKITKAMKVDHFNAHLREQTLQTFKNISLSNKKTFDDMLILFRQKYVKPES